MASMKRRACYVRGVLSILVLLSVTLHIHLFRSAEYHLLPTHLQTHPSGLHQQQQQRPTATEDVPQGPKLTWKDGCQVWANHGMPANEQRILAKSSSSSSSSSSTASPPTGIAVTLAKRTKTHGARLLDLLCQKVPTQQAYFYEPQGIDLLILMDVEDVFYHQVADCLELQAVSEKPLEWPNLDGSVLTTYEYRSKTGRGKVYLAPFQMPYPQYIQQNPSRLTEPMEGCDRGKDFEDYIQGTRYYSNDVLHLSILQDYDYLLKVDLDIEFRQAFPFHLLHDMMIQGAVFGHSGEFLPKGFGGCTKNINRVVESFVQVASQQARTNSSHVVVEQEAMINAWAQQSNWTRPCSAGIDACERGKDQYYTNLVVMLVDFFQSEHVRSYGRWMNEYYPGFFRYGWTDQLFFHKAMGLFLGPDFREYVADYTDFRCKKFPTCWFPWAGDGNTSKTSPSHFCEAGGIFHHGKSRSVFGPFDGVFPNLSATLASSPYISQYQHDCKRI